MNEGARRSPNRRINRGTMRGLGLKESGANRPPTCYVVQPGVYAVQAFRCDVV